MENELTPEQERQINEALDTRKDLVIPEQKPKLKLFKNTKGFNWEIQLLELDIEKLDKLNDEMIKRFGGTDGE